MKITKKSEESWEKEFDEKFLLSEYDYKLMDERGVFGAKEQIKKLKSFILKGQILSMNLPEPKL